MAEPMAIDKSKKTLKRKREKLDLVLTSEEREMRVKNLRDELESLFDYFGEVLGGGLGLGLGLGFGGSVNGVIAGLLEERRCSYSKLVGEVYERVKERDNGGVTMAGVKSSVLFVGQRVAYGVPSSVDVDVLEDESRSCLWCWETRDMKLLPSSVRGELKIRRLCRKKINERITAILELISYLEKPEDHPIYKHEMTKAAEKLSKVLAEADIRLLVESLAKKNDSEMAEKEAKKKGTTIIKELEKNKREAEKEKKRMDRELQKEKLLSEKEKKRLQQEAEREEKRREKEESEMKKHLKKKQEESEREQRRKEKEEAELKKQRCVQKQASIMQSFLKRSRTSTSQNDQSPRVATSGLNDNTSGSVIESVCVVMDSALQHKDQIDVDEIRKSHMNSWRNLGHSIRSNKKQNWGLRRKPKTELVKELKLTTNKVSARDDDMCIINLVDGWEETNTDAKSCHANSSTSSLGIRKSFRRKQLLQFDKSHRPAFYGIWPKKSCVVRPHNPLKKDPELDYEIDSDEEWEEEDPGESLSDSEKEEEEILDEGSLKADDEEESEDGFFVPDGYLSENEGVETDRSKSNPGAEVALGQSSCKPEAESEESSAWVKQQKYLHNLTEHALRKNQPLIIINLMHEKEELLSAEDLSGTQKLEQMCLQALRMRPFPGGMSIEVPNNNLQEENLEACTSTSKGSTVATRHATTIPDSELPKIVSVIQSCPQGIGRVIEALQQKFPDIPKSHLGNKVREISDFVDNRWKVKKEILEMLGLSSSPEKSAARTKSIATFFSKRCLPPSGRVVNPCESSPESMKPGSSSQQQPQQECANNV